MPSVSEKQRRLMAAVAHGWKKPGGGGPSVAVAKEFNAADVAEQSHSLADRLSGKPRKGRLQKMVHG